MSTQIAYMYVNNNHGLFMSPKKTQEPRPILAMNIIWILSNFDQILKRQKLFFIYFFYNIDEP